MIGDTFACFGYVSGLVVNKTIAMHRKVWITVSHSFLILTLIFDNRECKYPRVNMTAGK